MDTVWFEVSADWLAATGTDKSGIACAYPVVRSYDRGLMAFVDLDMGEGRVWTVNAEWRGRFVNPPAAEGADPAYNAARYHGVIPEHTAAIWQDGKVTNKGTIPLWSGKGTVPSIGTVVTCADRKGTRCMVTGYSVEAGWLMVTGYRIDDPTVKGNLAGAEILA